MDLALNNQQWLICHKTKLTKQMKKKKKKKKKKALKKDYFQREIEKFEFFF